MVFLGTPISLYGYGCNYYPCKLLVIRSPDFYYLIHKEPKIRMKVMDNFAQVMASRFKGTEDFLNR